MMLAHGRIDAVVADERIAEHEQLAVVRRIGECFFVAGHAGEKHRFALSQAVGTDTGAVEARAVFQNQHRRPAHATISPPTTASAGRTVNLFPANGVIRPSDLKRSGSTVHGLSR